MALTADISRARYDGGESVEGGLAASVVIYLGSILVKDVAGYVRARAATATDSFYGISETNETTASATAGATLVAARRNTPIWLSNSSTSACTAALIGQTAYLEDDEYVRGAATGAGVAIPVGEILDVDATKGVLVDCHGMPGGVDSMAYVTGTGAIACLSLNATTTVVAGTNITATAGNIAATAGSVSAGTTVTAGTGITATTGNIAASAGNVSASGTVTGGTGVTATTGDVVASAGQVNANTTMTAGTGITATTGNIVATAGAVQAGTTVTAGTDLVGTNRVLSPVYSSAGGASPTVVIPAGQTFVVENAGGADGLVITDAGLVTAPTGNLVATVGNIIADAGNITATLGAVVAGTTVTGGTGIIATTGNVQASAGSVIAVGATSDLVAGRAVVIPAVDFAQAAAVPTQLDMVNAFGAAAAHVDETRILHDTTLGGNCHCYSDGTNWYYIQYAVGA